MLTLARICPMFQPCLANAGPQVVDMDALLEAGLSYVKALTVIVRAASTAGKLDGLALPAAVSDVLKRGCCDVLHVMCFCCCLLGPPPHAVATATFWCSLLPLRVALCRMCCATGPGLCPPPPHTHTRTHTLSLIPPPPPNPTPGQFDVEAGYFDSLMISLDSMVSSGGRGAPAMATSEARMLQALFDACAEVCRGVWLIATPPPPHTHRRP
jgi:hypothetical protein